MRRPVFRSARWELSGRKPQGEECKKEKKFNLESVET